MKDNLIEKIKQLPPLPESALKIEAIYQDPDSSFNDMVKVLENDPLLTADILKAANSPLYGFSREINSIARAVSLFGMGAIRGFALSSIVKQSFKIDLSPYGMNNDQFSSLSKQQHALMTNICMKKHRPLLDTLSPAAFLVEIGKVIISQFVLENDLVKDFQALISQGMIEKAEESVCETSTEEVSATIFDHWRFEEALVDIIKNCRTPENAGEDNQLAAQILHVVRVGVPMNGIITPESEKEAVELATTYDLDITNIQDAFKPLTSPQE